MKQIISLPFLLLFFYAKSQNRYWQQYLSYSIDVQLDTTSKTLSGKEIITYKNYSPDTLTFIWFHLYPNAYKDSTTALYDQMKKDADKKDDIKNYEHGFISNVLFTVNGEAAKTQPHPNKQYIDMTRLLLPHPLLPGDSVTIATPFTVKLPSYFSRSGFDNGEFMICQWYPKPAVYDKSGWHEMPYLDMGEFYSEYASYRVHITVPAGMVVGATGVLQNADELAAYKSIGSYNKDNRKGTPRLYQASSDKPKTLHYAMDSVPDFAWFADASFVIEYDTLQLSPGKTTDVFAYHHNIKNTSWVNSTDYLKDGVTHYSRWIGGYSYPVVQAVEGPKNSSSGGMEYPTITLITAPDAEPPMLDDVIAHEVGHNWFMSMLGTNERDHAWMDEGVNSYYEFRYTADKYRTNLVFGDLLPEAMKKASLHDFQLQIYNAMSIIPIQPAIETSSADFRDDKEYALVVYIKAAEWMFQLENAIGITEVDSCFQHYFALWKNKHPQPEDMRTSFEQVTHSSLADYFGKLNKPGRL